jgi:hypothetical protein
MADELEHLRLELSAEWASKTVTTDPPRYIPHQEWRLMLQLTSTSPLRVIHVLRRAKQLSWGLGPESPTTDLALAVDFFPQDWKSSDGVQINFGWRSMAVTDRSLKEDPHTQVAVTLPNAAETGRLVNVCELPAHGISVEMLVIAAGDTEPRRNDRWRVRPDLASHLPAGLEPVATGHQSGVIRLHNGP